MADWNTHIYCANIVNRKLQFEGKELDLFLYGNVLPDVNAGYVITPVTKIKQAVTHFEEGFDGQSYFWVPVRFYEKYSDEIIRKNPLVLGYLFHLWLDVSIMTDFVSRVPVSSFIDNGFEVKKWKWNDMGIFISNHTQNIGRENISLVAEASKCIDEISVCEEDLIRVTEFFDHFVSNTISDDYLIYDEASLKNFYDKTCEEFVIWVNARTSD